MPAEALYRGMGTIFESSRVALPPVATSDSSHVRQQEGISTRQIHRMLNCSMKSAWFLGHRIREVMAPGADAGPLGGAGKIVEADETYLGTADGKARQESLGGMGHG